MCRILIVRAGALGDTLMVTPLIRALHMSGSTSIDFLASRAGAELLNSNPYLSDILVLGGRNVPYPLSREKHNLVEQIRDRSYSRAILLESAPQYRELLERAGLQDIRDFSTDPWVPTQHSIVNYLRVGGFQDLPPEALEMDLPVQSSALTAAAELLRGLWQPIVGIHPGYGPVGKKEGQTNRLKGWTSENFGQLAEAFAKSGASIVLTGSREDIDTCEAIQRFILSGESRVIAGKTSVPVLAGIIKTLDVFISVDSGPAHMAAAISTPLVVLWGPAIFEQVRPMSAKAPIAILRAGVPCAPCYGTHLMKTCRRNICMEYITPDQVIQSAMAALNRRDRLLAIAPGSSSEK